MVNNSKGYQGEGKSVGTASKFGLGDPKISISPNSMTLKCVWTFATVLLSKDPQNSPLEILSKAWFIFFFFFF